MFSGKIQTIIRVEENAELVKIQWNCSEIGLIKTESYIPQKKTGLKRVELCSGGMEIKNFRKWPDTQELMSINQRYDFCASTTDIFHKISTVHWGIRLPLYEYRGLEIIL